MILKIILIIVISIVLQLIFVSISTSINKYEYNGKTVYDFLSHKNSNSGDDDNNPLTFVEYPIGTDCSAALNKLGYTWKNLTTEHTVSEGVNIPANSNSNMGYCLKIEIGADEDDIPCTLTNGGTKLFKINERGNFGFFCYCQEPHKFVNNYVDNDCTQYTGCKNGKYDPNTKRCECFTGYNEYQNELGVFNCRLITKYKNGSIQQYSLGREFIDDEYLEFLSSTNIQLPNPCLMDIRTNKIFPDAGQIILDTVKNVAYCVSKDSRFIAVRVNDDYLKNNGGKYANAILQYTNVAIPKGERVPEMYETTYKLNKPIKRGVRLLYKEFLIKLPYLEKDSQNMLSAGGLLYDKFPILTNEKHFDTRKVYVYEGPKPINEEPQIGTFAVFCAYFLNHEDYFVGMLATYNPYRRKGAEHYYDTFNGGINHIPREHMPSGDLGKAKDDSPNVIIYRSFYPIFGTTFIYDSIWSTGIYMTYTKDNLIYTKTISPHTELLVSKFKTYIDSDWNNIRENIKNICVKDAINYERQIIGNTRKHMWPENSFSYDLDAVCTPDKHTARIREDTDELSLLTPNYDL